MISPALLRPALSMLSPGGPRARLSILIYHRVLPAPDPFLDGDPDAETFRWQMQLLARHFNPLSLNEAVSRLREGTLPARAVCVTFDDGYADNLTVAAPVLQEVGVPATFFIATGYLDGGQMFNDILIEAARRIPAGKVDLAPEPLGVRTVANDADRVTLAGELIRHFKYLPAAERSERVDTLVKQLGISVPDDLMLTTAQLRDLHSTDRTIGAHTVTHPILTRLTEQQARDEMASGKRHLESLLGEPVTLFAYPNGRLGSDYQREHTVLAEECGFQAAVSTRWGTAGRNSDLYQLPRFTPWDRTPLGFGLRMARNLAGRP